MEAGYKNTKRIWVHSLFLLYILILLRITIFRSDFSVDALFQNGEINLKIFQEYIPMITEGKWFLFLYLFIGNLICFVPFGAYIMWTGRIKRVCHAVMLSLLFSLIIECLQYAFGTGISEIDDLILNSMGGWLGACIFYRITPKEIKNNDDNKDIG